jgi:hypothetical protein
MRDASRRTAGVARGIGTVRREQPLYVAGECVEPGVYREVERGITVRLLQSMPLPDLNSYQPSRFLPDVKDRWLLGWWPRRTPSMDPAVLYAAGQQVSAGRYRDVERGVVVRLDTAGTLPDLQSGAPSRYRKVRAGKVRVRARQ